MVMVLEGGYHDGDLAFGPGDVQTSGPEIEHCPVADPDGECLCLVVVKGGFRLGGWLGRLVKLLGY
jgi:putative transcriptional regulator